MKRMAENKVSKIIRNSLIYNLMKMFCVVLCLLWALFLFSPNEAHIDMNTNSDVDIKNIESKHIEVQGDLNLNISFFEETKINLHNKLVTMGGKKYEVNYDEEMYLLIRSNIYPVTLYFTSSDGYARFQTDNQNSRVSFEKSSILSNPYNINVVSKHFSIHFDNPFTISSLFIGNKFLQVKDKIIPVTSEIKVSARPKDEPVFVGSYFFETKKDAQAHITYMQALVEMRNVKSIKANYSDELTFSYSPDAKNYSLRGQDISFKSNNAQLSSSIKSHPYKIDYFHANGIVNAASISDMSLFPSFAGWYRSNVYLAPLTLVSVVFGALEFIKSKRKS